MLHKNCFSGSGAPKYDNTLRTFENRKYVLKNNEKSFVEAMSWDGDWFSYLK
jgi:hypothetical protein